MRRRSRLVTLLLAVTTAYLLYAMIPHALLKRTVITSLIAVDLAAGVVVQSLDGDWRFRNDVSLSNVSAPLSGSGVVPGDIYTDLRNAGIIDDPLYADNDIVLRWVTRETWTYGRNFTPTTELLQTHKQLLVFEGLDTVAHVRLNGEAVLETNNQFVQYTVDVTGKLKQDLNSIEVTFQSPVRYGEAKAAEYLVAHNYSIPPSCPPEIFHGECHSNYIRKVQSSFSWDWGPAFPSIGIWQPVRLEGHHGLHVENVVLTTTIAEDTVILTVQADIHSKDSHKVVWDLSIPEIAFQANFITPANDARVIETTAANFRIPRESVELWWPNGYGQQKLYTATFKFTRLDKKASYSTSIRFGVRKVELVQDYINRTNPYTGREFYFRVNDLPVFLKGSNWIPVSPFPAQNNSERMRFLLESARVAGMNGLRVWGGGRYESEEFYNMADELGILIWQDMMFACALYPTDPAFLSTVKEEITQNVKRLMNHPSILVWAGNNENELGITGGWWSARNYNSSQVRADYKQLYVKTIKPLVVSIDPSRPFVLSSPSNGIDTDEAGGIATNPGGTQYGDIHFYNEVLNLWKDHSYKTPRCATEYGLQSLPSGLTMRNYLDEADYHYFSKNYTQRQHHPGGEYTLITMAFSHFPFPTSCGQPADRGKQVACVQGFQTYLDRFVYYTQFHQALTYKTETEHYIRYRNELNERGEGHTMCALYWQLNDVWAAPTWSSIDWDLRWKPVHYEAKRFFSPNYVIIYIDVLELLDAYLANDKPQPLTNATVQIDCFAFNNGFTPVYRYTAGVDAPAFSSTHIDLIWLRNKLNATTTEEDFVFAARLFDASGKQIGPTTTVVPDKLYHVDLAQTGDVKISSLTKISDTEYSVEIVADAVAPFVWIEVTRAGFVGYFDDNAFTMVEPRRTLTMTVKKPLDKPLSVDDLYACALKSCYVTSASFL